MSDFVEKLCKSLNLEVPNKDKDKSYLFEISDDIQVKIWDFDPGFNFHSNIALCPNENKEDLFIYLMRANLLGQGTGRARIGMDKEEKFLTLSYDIAYEVTYIEFKEKLEDFVNFLIYWRGEIEKHKKAANETIL